MKKRFLVLILIALGSVMFARPELLTDEKLVKEYTEIINDWHGDVVRIYLCYSEDDIYSLVYPDKYSWEHIMTVPCEEFHEDIYPTPVIVFRDMENMKFYGMILRYMGHRLNFLLAPL